LPPKAAPGRPADERRVVQRLTHQPERVPGIAVGRVALQAPDAGLELLGDLDVSGMSPWRSRSACCGYRASGSFPRSRRAAVSGPVRERDVVELGAAAGAVARRSYSRR
jgi:hypothetical protein